MNLPKNGDALSNRPHDAAGTVDGATYHRPQIRRRLLDAFCCEGGAAEGYHRAGFDVFGVDTNPGHLARYPFPREAMGMPWASWRGCAEAIEQASFTTAGENSLAALRRLAGT